MQEKIEFRKALQEIIQIAAKSGSRIKKETVEEHLKLSGLTEEQRAMVYQYLLSQKICVEGMESLADTVNGMEALSEPEKEETLLSEEDKFFLQEYLKSMDEESGWTDPEYQKYMKQCAGIAMEYAGKGIPLADLIQEGNVGLIMAMNSLELRDDTVSKDEYIREGIRGMIETLLEEETELKESDDRMLEKINYIAEAIRNLSEELERKVSLEELSAYLEMPQEEVAKILKLTGEEIEEVKKTAEDAENEAAVGYADISDFKVF